MTPKELFTLTTETSRALLDNPKVKAFQVVGSSLIEGVEAKDLDFLVHVDASGFLGMDPVLGMDPEMPLTARWAFGPGWSTCAGEYDDMDDKWGALRNGHVNLIVTVDEGWYKRAAQANEVCVALGLKDKGDRIVVYRVIRDGYTAEAANQKRDGSN